MSSTMHWPYLGVIIVQKIPSESLQYNSTTVFMTCNEMAATVSCRHGSHTQVSTLPYPPTSQSPCISMAISHCIISIPWPGPYVSWCCPLCSSHDNRSRPLPADLSAVLIMDVNVATSILTGFIFKWHNIISMLWSASVGAAVFTSNVTTINIENFYVRFCISFLNYRLRLIEADFW